MLVIIDVMILICAAPSVEGVDQPQSASTSMTQSVYQPASLSRVFIGVQPGRGVARLTKVGKPSGPMSLVSEDTHLRWLLQHALSHECVAVAAFVHCGGNNFGCSTVTAGVSCKGVQHLSWLWHQQVGLSGLHIKHITATKCPAHSCLSFVECLLHMHKSCKQRRCTASACWLLLLFARWLYV